MRDTLPFLKSLISAPGLSGHEGVVHDLIVDAWRPIVDEISTSRLGSLHALRRGTAPEPRPSLLLAAHMDAIGLIVTGVVDGLLRFTEVGGVDPRVLPGQLVCVHGREELPGVVVQPPGFLLPASVRDKAIPMEYLLVDVGLQPKEVAARVRVGDLISFAQEPLQLGDEFLAGHSLDNRASVAALTECLQQLQGRQQSWDIWAVATVQEEETFGGAFTSTFQLRPSLAVAVDVTHASGPGSPAHKTYPMGKGVTLAVGPNIHPGLFKRFKELADRFEIPYKVEPTPRMSGTDAVAMQVVAEGVPTFVLSIPLRYMHTPVEVVSMKDIARAGRLLAEFAASLDDTFLDQLTWDD